MTKIEAPVAVNYVNNVESFNNLQRLSIKSLARKGFDEVKVSTSPLDNRRMLEISHSH